MYNYDCHLHQPNVSLLVLKKETLPVNRRGQKKKKKETEQESNCHTKKGIDK